MHEKRLKEKKLIKMCTIEFQLIDDRVEVKLDLDGFLLYFNMLDRI